MAKKIAIMQPYIFPYLGYFQLINIVDKFIFLDDVNFIKKGYIHRNEIPIGDSKYRFSIPLKKRSQNKLINETFIHDEKYNSWKLKFLKTIDTQYSSAPNFRSIKDLIEDVLCSEEVQISKLSARSIQKTCKYLDIDSVFKFSSEVNQNNKLSGQSKIIDICLTEKAEKYYNLAGGKDLYNHENFNRNQLSLNFIKLQDVKYLRDRSKHHPYISILDLLMYQTKSEIQPLLNAYETF